MESERLVRGVCRKAFPITSLFFSFPHSFYFEHLGRKTFLTASKHRVLREAGAAVGGRHGLQKPTCKDQLTRRPPGLPWESRAVDSADRSTWSPGDRHVLCSPCEPLSLPETFLHEQTEAGKALPQHAGTQTGRTGLCLRSTLCSSEYKYLRGIVLLFELLRKYEGTGQGYREFTSPLCGKELQ